MTFDDKGRMIVSDQYGYLYCITIPPVGSDTSKSKVKVEKLEIMMLGDKSKAKIKIGLAHGLNSHPILRPDFPQSPEWAGYCQHDGECTSCPENLFGNGIEKS